MEDGSGAGVSTGVGIVGVVIYLAVVLVFIIGTWKLYAKAGKPGWASIVPIYNIIVLLEIIGRPLWWIVLFLIPFVNAIAWIITCIDLAKSFGQGIGIGILNLFGIGQLILGFGGATYQGPAAAK